MNVAGVLRVIQIGLPAKLSFLVNELGISGCEGSKSSIHLFICEKSDLTRLKYWTNEVTYKERSIYYEDYQITVTQITMIIIIRMVSYFKFSILNAMKVGFPVGTSRGCWFHFGQVSVF